MISAILIGWLRHALTSLATGLILDGLHTLSPSHIAAGGVIGAIGLGLSAASKIKVKTVSGPDYSTLNK